MRLKCQSVIGVLIITYWVEHLEFWLTDHRDVMMIEHEMIAVSGLNCNYAIIYLLIEHWNARTNRSFNACDWRGIFTMMPMHIPFLILCAVSRGMPSRSSPTHACSSCYCDSQWNIYIFPNKNQTPKNNNWQNGYRSSVVFSLWYAACVHTANRAITRD